MALNIKPSIKWSIINTSKLFHFFTRISTVNFDVRMAFCLASILLKQTYGPLFWNGTDFTERKDVTVSLGKAPIALDTLPLLEHAAANDTTREAENPKCYCSRRVIILYSPPTVGAVVPEIWLWTYASQDRAYPTRFSYSSLYFALHLWHHPYITSVGSLACKIEMMG